MKTLILDESKWRCGSDSKSLKIRRGRGETRLLNKEGYMCCLGQFSLQLNKNLRKEDIFHLFWTEDIEKKVPLLNKKCNSYICSTKLAEKAIMINDSVFTTVEEKVKKLRGLFKKEGYRIIFKRIKK